MDYALLNIMTTRGDVFPVCYLEINSRDEFGTQCFYRYFNSDHLETYKKNHPVIFGYNFGIYKETEKMVDDWSRLANGEQIIRTIPSGSSVRDIITGYLNEALNTINNVYAENDPNGKEFK